MEDHDVSQTLGSLLELSLTIDRYSEILDYHNVDAAQQAGEDNDS
jgi:hypothetical protein